MTDWISSTPLFASAKNISSGAQKNMQLINESSAYQQFLHTNPNFTESSIESSTTKAADGTLIFNPQY